MKDEGSTALLRRLARLLLILMTARYRPSASVIAARLGVSERQAKRYLRALAEAGWQLPAPRGEW